MSFVSSMALGADCIEDCELLRVARTGEVLGHRVVARQRSARFCGRSASGMFASSTASWPDAAASLVGRHRPTRGAAGRRGFVR
jgi:hypothetical protein